MSELGGSRFVLASAEVSPGTSFDDLSVASGSTVLHYMHAECCESYQRVSRLQGYPNSHMARMYGARREVGHMHHVGMERVAPNKVHAVCPAVKHQE